MNLIMSQHDMRVADYQAKRAALIDDDRALRPDYARAANFSTAELTADTIVRSIRTAEATSVWDAEHANVPHPFPGMEFLTGTHLVVGCA